MNTEGEVSGADDLIIAVGHHAAELSFSGVAFLDEFLEEAVDGIAFGFAGAFGG